MTDTVFPERRLLLSANKHLFLSQFHWDFSWFFPKWKNHCHLGNQSSTVRWKLTVIQSTFVCSSAFHSTPWHGFQIVHRSITPPWGFLSSEFSLFVVWWCCLMSASRLSQWNLLMMLSHALNRVLIDFRKNHHFSRVICVISALLMDNTLPTNIPQIPWSTLKGPLVYKHRKIADDRSMLPRVCCDYTLSFFPYAPQEVSTHPPRHVFLIAF